MAKKTSAWVRQETISSSKIGKEVQKPYCGKGPGWLSFLDYAQSIFFSSCLIGYGIDVTPACRVIKKLKIDHLWLYMLYPTPWSNGNSPLHIYRERLLHGWFACTIFIHLLWRIARQWRVFEKYKPRGLFSEFYGSLRLDNRLVIVYFIHFVILTEIRTDMLWQTA